MKRMKMHEVQQPRIVEKVICSFGNHLTKMAVTPRQCLGIVWYEPELSEEMITEEL